MLTFWVSVGRWEELCGVLVMAFKDKAPDALWIWPTGHYTVEQPPPESIDLCVQYRRIDDSYAELQLEVIELRRELELARRSNPGWTFRAVQLRGE